MYLFAGKKKIKDHNALKIYHVVRAIRTEHLQVLYVLKILPIIKLFKEKNTENISANNCEKKVLTKNMSDSCIIENH